MEQAEQIQSRKCLYVMGVTSMICFAAYEGSLGLQSSMNVEEGLGTTSVMVIFITSSFSSILVVPWLIDFCGAKTAIIAGEIGFAVYIAANFYPSWYTLVPAAIFHGLTESAPWAGTSVYVTFLGKQRWRKKRGRSLSPASEQKPMESYVYRYFGHFYSFVYMGGVLGFVLVSVVLLGFKNVSVTQLNNNPNSSTNVNMSEIMNLTTYATTTAPIDYHNPLEKCGASDCQAEYIYNGTNEELEKFIPNPSSTYLLLAIFIAISTISMVLQAIYLPRAPAKYDKKRNASAEDEVLDDKPTETSIEVQVPTNVFNVVVDELRQTFFHIISPLHLLAAPIIFYYGMFYAFLITEFSRAFVSCTLGVEQVGLVSTVVGVTAVLFSNVCARILLAVGRQWFLVVIGGAHMAVYLFSLFWLPNPANSWITYLLAVIIGVGEAANMNGIQGITAVYFHDRVGIAFSVKNCITNLGIVAVTGWSTYTCVDTKIYLQIGGLIISLISLAGAEMLFNRMRKPHQNNKEIDTSL